MLRFAFLQGSARGAAQRLEFAHGTRWHERCPREGCGRPDRIVRTRGNNMEWNDLESDGPALEHPSIRSLLYDRGGVLFDDPSISDLDEADTGWDDELPEDDLA
jgi:hypothetical protein